MSAFPFLWPKDSGPPPAKRARTAARSAARRDPPAPDPGRVGLEVGEVKVSAAAAKDGLAVVERGALCWVDALSPAQRAELTLQPRVSSLAPAGGAPAYPVYCEHRGRFGVPRFYAMAVLRAAGAAGAAPPPPPPPPPPRPYPRFAGRLAERQRAALDAARVSLREHGGAMLVLPCGFGKTVIALALAAAMGEKTLVLVHKECLLDQWEERIRQFLPGAGRVGRIQQSHVETAAATLDTARAEDIVARVRGVGPKLAARVVDHQPYGDDPLPGLAAAGLRGERAARLIEAFSQQDRYPLVLGMVQSIAAKDYDPAVLRGFGMVVVDEAHHICARMFSRALRKLPAPHVVGLSATPERSDGLGHCLPWFLGPVAYRAERTYAEARVRVHDYLPEDPGQRTEIVGRGGHIQMARMVTRLVRDRARRRLVRRLVLAALREPAERYVMVLSERLELLAVLEGQLRLLTAAAPQPDGSVVLAVPAGLDKADVEAATAAAPPAPTPAALRRRLPPRPRGEEELAALWSCAALVRQHWVEEAGATAVRWAEGDAAPAPAAIGRYVGGLKAEDRRRSGACRVVLASYAMCAEGLDIPRLDTLVMATPRSNVEQSLGRILRLHPDKQTPRVHDVVDKYSVFAAMGWKRRRLYKRLGFRVEAALPLPGPKNVPAAVK